MTEVQAGLVASLAAYLLGSALWVRLARTLWARQPAQLPDELQRLRQEAREWTLRSYLRVIDRQGLVYMAGAAALFGLLWAAAFDLLTQVLFVGIISAYWTHAEMAGQSAQIREMRDRLDAQMTRPTRPLVVMAHLALFMIHAGALGAVCFLGGLAARVVD